MPEPSFSFQPRWKEELVVTGNGGSFVLELTMGPLAAYLPTEAEWRRRAPDCAVQLWPTSKAELELWCHENKAGFYIDHSASLYSL